MDKVVMNSMLMAVMNKTREWQIVLANQVPGDTQEWRVLSEMGRALHDMQQRLVSLKEQYEL